MLTPSPQPSPGPSPSRSCSLSRSRSPGSGLSGSESAASPASVDLEAHWQAILDDDDADFSLVWPCPRASARPDFDSDEELLDRWQAAEEAYFAYTDEEEGDEDYEP